jgi:hypothetical protein
MVGSMSRIAADVAPPSSEEAGAVGSHLAGPRLSPRNSARHSSQLRGSPVVPATSPRWPRPPRIVRVSVWLPITGGTVYLI